MKDFSDHVSQTVTALLLFASLTPQTATPSVSDYGVMRPRPFSGSTLAPSQETLSTFVSSNLVRPSESQNGSMSPVPTIPPPALQTGANLVVPQANYPGSVFSGSPISPNGPPAGAEPYDPRFLLDKANALSE